MDSQELEKLVDGLLGGSVGREAFLNKLRQGRTLDVDDAHLDLDRAPLRISEVVYGEGKSITALENILAGLIASGVDVLATRINVEQAEAMQARFSSVRYNPVGRILRIPLQTELPPKLGKVSVITAGTSDASVAEEACETLEWMRVDWTLVRDVGVAGPQRLRQRLPLLVDSDAVVVIAGMEGALPSVVGGYVPCPVIGVPTSVGYGANFGGVAALLSMLNSCASNVTVVNIDCGFKGAYIAGMIAKPAQSGR